MTIAYLLFQVQLGVREYRHLKRVPLEEPLSGQQFAALESGFAVDNGNYLTAYKIGELYRLRAWRLELDYEEDAANAILWFDRVLELNPYYHEAFLRKGMSLDWLGRHDEAEVQFRHADQLDPRGHHTAAYVGWHYLQVRNYAAAQAWFERSMALKPKDNQMSEAYLGIVRDRMLEAAAERVSLPPLVQ
jgi:tetratricopeptide (TPR) repeat protein